MPSTPVPRPGHAERSAPSSRPSLSDRLWSADPGLVRLRSATQAVLTLAAVIGAEWLFVRATHALQTDASGLPLPAPRAALAAAKNHAALVMAMALGGLTMLNNAMAPSQPTPRLQLRQLASLLVPMTGGLVVGVAGGDHRVLGLALFVVAVSAWALLIRFGPWGIPVGLALFSGYLAGFLLHGATTAGGVRWMAAELGLGWAVAVIIQFTLFVPRPAAALRRIQRSFAASFGEVARMALDDFERRAALRGRHARDGRRRRLERRLVRLNQAALIVDGQLATPGALDGGSRGQRLHEQVFDIEVALANVARFARELGLFHLASGQRVAVRQALTAIRDGDLAAARAAAADLTSRTPGAAPLPQRVTSHRFTSTVNVLADALDAMSRDGGPAPGDGAEFTTAVRLAGGALPGSAVISARASMHPDRQQRWYRRHMPPYLRFTVQLLVAGTVAVVAGDALSGEHFYWAPMAAMLTAFGTSSVGERHYKGALRVAGTVIGIVIGYALARAVGQHTHWAIAVALAGLFFAVYLVRVNYACFIVGLVVLLSQLYTQLGESTGTVLLWRLAENALGVAVMMIVSACVLPLRTRHVLHVAVREHTAALAVLVGHATDRLLRRSSRAAAATALRADVRRLDVAHQALLAAAGPIPRWLPSADPVVGTLTGLAGTCSAHARSLAHVVTLADGPDEAARTCLERASDTLVNSITGLARSLGDAGAPGTYVSAAALFVEAAARSERGRREPVTHDRSAIRDLMLIDQATAALAETFGAPLADYDTAAPRDHQPRSVTVTS